MSETVNMVVMMNTTPLYLSATKTVHLAWHHNLASLSNCNQASTTHKVWLVKTHNLLLKIIRILTIISIVLDRTTLEHII